MSQLRLYAVPQRALSSYIGEGAGQLRLRMLAAERFATGTARVGLRGRLGPLTTRPTLPLEDPADLPQRSDVDALLSGAPIPPGRLPQAWRLIGHWLAAQSTAHLNLELAYADLADLDGVAARCGRNTDLGFLPLFESPGPLRLTPLPGMRVGYRGPLAFAATRAAYAALPAHETEGTLLGQYQRWLLSLDEIPLEDEGLLGILTEDAERQVLPR